MRISGGLRYLLHFIFFLFSHFQISSSIRFCFFSSHIFFFLFSIMLLSNPATWKLSQMVVPGTRPSLDMKFASPGGSSKMYDTGGIGLGIVASLEKSGNGIHNPVCYFESGSDPVRCSRRLQFATEIDLSEEYTCVTTRDGLTKVYYNDQEFEFGLNQSDGDKIKKKPMVIADKSPATKKDVAFRDSPDFLTSCCLCKKKLQGKDIYMYKGDKGFCSKECRSVKIMEDNSMKNIN